MQNTTSDLATNSTPAAPPGAQRPSLKTPDAQRPSLKTPDAQRTSLTAPDAQRPSSTTPDTQRLPSQAPASCHPPPHTGLLAAIDLLQTLRAIDPEFPIQYALCLSEIARHEHLSVTELAQRTRISLSTVSRIVSALSNRKGRYGLLINVRFSPLEARRKELSLTAQGHNFIKNMTGNICFLVPK